MFSNGNWIGFFTVVFTVIGIWVAQSYHEKGHEWARPVQYAIGVLFLAFMIWLGTQLL